MQHFYPITYKHLFFALALLLAALPAAQAQNGLPVQDSVFTLKTQEPIYGRGAVGGIAIDQLGFLYAANFRQAVHRVDINDGSIKLLGDGFLTSSGNNMDSQGRLLQSSFNDNKVYRIDRWGGIETVIDTGLTGPVGVLEASDGAIYVCNCRANSISKYTPEGGVQVLASGTEHFNCPNGITQGHDGALYVSNFSSDNVIRVSLEGEASTFATVGASGGNAHLVFSQGFYYVTDINAHALYRVGTDGSVSTIIAPSTGRETQDGPASQAKIGSPNGICAAGNGDIYISGMNPDARLWQAAQSEVVITRVKVATLPNQLNTVLAIEDERESLKELARIYKLYHAQPAFANQSTNVAAVTTAWQWLAARKPAHVRTLMDLVLERSKGKEYWQLHWNYGQMLKILGDKKAAIKQLEETLRINPEHAGAQAMLNEMKS